jgi:putative transposase
MPRSDGARSQPYGVRHRLSERKGRGKRGGRIDPSGYDAGKKIKGKKRHILVDTVGLLLHAVVHPANIQDRDGAILVLATLFGKFPFLKKLFADGGYQGPIFEQAQKRVLPVLRRFKWN